MEVFGFIAAGLIGISLGLIGGGGSILAVPVLAYIFLLDEKTATAYSLFIVGFSALIGGIQQHKNGNVDWKTATIFGIPAVIGVWLVRHYVVPVLPDVLFNIGYFYFTRRMAMFGLFALLMIVAAYNMLYPKSKHEVRGVVVYNYPLILLEGLTVGSITGFVGAGGGFLIIPALVMFANLEMKKAIGTSLIIIAFKSILGFLLGDALSMHIDWEFLGIFTIIALSGIYIGVFINNFIDGKILQKGFGFFIIIMAVFIITKEFIIH